MEILIGLSLAGVYMVLGASRWHIFHSGIGVASPQGGRRPTPLASLAEDTSADLLRLQSVLTQNATPKPIPGKTVVNDSDSPCTVKSLLTIKHTH